MTLIKLVVFVVATALFQSCVTSGGMSDPVSRPAASPERSERISYFAAVRGLIYRKWRYPAVANQEKLEGAIRLEFAIERNGNVQGIKIVKSSGHQLLDDTLVAAVKAASPYGPIAKMTDESRLIVVGDFKYHYFDDKAPRQHTARKNPAFDYTRYLGAKISEVKISGTQALSGATILRDLGIVVDRPTWSSRVFSDELWEQLVSDVSTYYRERGYEQVRVAAPLISRAAGEGGLVVDIEVQEGVQFRVGSLTVSGELINSTDALTDRLTLKSGMIFAYSMFHADIESLVDQYIRAGFPRVDVNPRTTFDQKSQLAAIEYFITKDGCSADVPHTGACAD